MESCSDPCGNSPDGESFPLPSNVTDEIHALLVSALETQFAGRCRKSNDNQQLVIECVRCYQCKSSDPKAALSALLGPLKSAAEGAWSFSVTVDGHRKEHADVVRATLVRWVKSQ